MYTDATRSLLMHWLGQNYSALGRFLDFRKSIFKKLYYNYVEWKKKKKREKKKKCYECNANFIPIHRSYWLFGMGYHLMLKTKGVISTCWFIRPKWWWWCFYLQKDTPTLHTLFEYNAIASNRTTHVPHGPSTFQRLLYIPPTPCIV